MHSTGKTGKAGSAAGTRHSNWPLSQQKIASLNLHCEMQTELLNSGGVLGGGVDVICDIGIESAEDVADRISGAFGKIAR